MSLAASFRSGETGKTLAAAHDIDDAILRIGLQQLADGLADPGLVLQPVGAKAARRPAAERRRVAAGHAELLLIVPGAGFGIDAPPLGQVLGDQDDADGAPDIGDAVGQRDHRADLLRRGAFRQRQDARIHRLFGRADGRRHGLRTGENAARSTWRQIHEANAQNDKRKTDDAADNRQQRELQSVATQAVHEGRADAQADAIHEEIVEHRLREVVEFKLHAIGRAPDGEAAADDDGGCHHAEAVARDGLSTDPDGQSNREEQQDEGIAPKPLEETCHDPIPLESSPRPSPWTFRTCLADGPA